jgi:hypothetical protein
MAGGPDYADGLMISRQVNVLRTEQRARDYRVVADHYTAIL